MSMKVKVGGTWRETVYTKGDGTASYSEKNGNTIPYSKVCSGCASSCSSGGCSSRCARECGDNCRNMVSINHSGECGDCSPNCTSVCGGCTNECGGCGGNCDTDCVNACRGRCDEVCTGSCDSCKNSCNADCGSNCTGHCDDTNKGREIGTNVKIGNSWNSATNLFVKVAGSWNKFD